MLRFVTRKIVLLMIAGIFQGLAMSTPAAAAPFGSAVFRGDAMLIGSGMPAPGTNNFTYEFYFKMTALPSVAGTNTVGGGIWLFTTRPNRYSAGGITLFVNTNGSLSLTANDSASKDITEILSASGSVSINNWYHLAITRSANVFTIWKNGTSVATGSALSAASGATGNYNGTGLSLGEYLPGNITNFRYSSETVLYSSTFPVPTLQLTANGTSQVLIPLESDYSSITSYSSFTPTLTQPTGVQTGKTAYYGGQGYQDATGNINDGSYLTNNGITYSTGNPFVKITPTFTWSNVSKNLGDANFTLTAPSPSTPGTFTYSSATTSVISLTGTTATVGNAGTSVITATFTPTNTADYSSTTTTMTITVTGNSQTITFPDLSPITLGGAAPTATATASSNLTVTFTSATTAVCTVTGTTITVLTTGTCTINANQAGNGTYAAAAQVQKSFVISPVPVVDDGAALAAAAAAAAKRAAEQKELTEILALIPKIAELTLSLGETTQSLYKQKCVKGKHVKYVKNGAKCPKGYVAFKKSKPMGS